MVRSSPSRQPAVHRPQAAARLSARLALGLVICLTACDDDPGAANVAVHTPDEVRTETGAARGSASSGGLGTPDHASVLSPSDDVSSDPVAESTPTSLTSGETSPTHNDQRSTAGDHTTPLTATADVTADTAADAATEGPVVGRCTHPISVTCNSRLHHDTRVNGQPSQFFGYECTARALGGPETMYELEGAAGCDVIVRLTGLESDLFVIATPTCEPFVRQTCSSLDPDDHDVERLMFTASTTERTLLSVDSYVDGAGPYILEVDCTCHPELDASAN